MRCAEMSLELLKATREGGPYTRDQLALSLGWSTNTLDRWLPDYVALGILIREKLPKEPGKHGHASNGYRLSPEWIGPRQQAAGG